MKNKHIILRQSAYNNIQKILDYYKKESAVCSGMEFLKNLKDAYGHIRQFPATGSLRYAYTLRVPNLRCWSIKNFPYLIFYIEENDHIDVWTILHNHQDIPSHLGMT